MILCIDVGNTNIKYGIFDGDELAVSFRVATEMKRTSDQYGTALLDMLAVKGVGADDIDGAIIASVVPSLNYTISHMCAGYLGVEPLMVGAGLKTEHNLRIDNAREMGADRIVNDVAAIRKYGAPVIVIDFGTATTFNAVNEQCEFIGGAIAPGIRSSMDSLVSGTARLPRVEIEIPKSVIGKNTTTNMQARAGIRLRGAGRLHRQKDEARNEAPAHPSGGDGRLQRDHRRRNILHRPCGQAPHAAGSQISIRSEQYGGQKMKSVGVAILGLGVVGGGTYKILTEHRDFYRRTQNIDISVESVLEINRQRALDLGVEESKISDNIAEVVSNPNVDIVVEVIGGVEPAKSFVLAALHSGKTVVTSNKELFCKYWYELEKAARRTNAGLYFEASCVGGVPIIRTLVDGLQANVLHTLTGIINGTTNYILTRMTRDGIDYAAALKDAQALGYAEKDPTADVEGFDAAYKLSILASLAFHTKVPLDRVYREGIAGIDTRDIAYGEELGYVLKLLAIGKKRRRGPHRSARPPPPSSAKTTRSPPSETASTPSFCRATAWGDVMLYGRGAGDLPTGSAIVSDVILRGDARRPQVRDL